MMISYSEKQKSRICKITRLCDYLAIDGNDVLLVAKDSEADVGHGLVYFTGAATEEPSAWMSGRRLLQELEHRFNEIGLDFDYTLTRKEKEDE